MILMVLFITFAFLLSGCGSTFMTHKSTTEYRSFVVEWKGYSEIMLLLSRYTNRPVFLYFSASKYIMCELIEEQTFKNQAVAYEMTHDFVPIFIDADKSENRNLLEKYGVREYPAIVFLSSLNEHEELFRSYGFLDKKHMLGVLKMIKEYNLDSIAEANTLRNK